jgi:hypothetical protein
MSTKSKKAKSEPTCLDCGTAIRFHYNPSAIFRSCAKARECESKGIEAAWFAPKSVRS